MFNLQIITENAAFHEEEVSYELSRILKVVINKLEEGQIRGLCYDSNGNLVGSWSLIKE